MTLVPIIYTLKWSGTSSWFPYFRIWTCWSRHTLMRWSQWQRNMRRLPRYRRMLWARTRTRSSAHVRMKLEGESMIYLNQVHFSSWSWNWLTLSVLPQSEFFPVSPNFPHFFPDPNPLQSVFQAKRDNRKVELREPEGGWAARYQTGWVFRSRESDRRAADATQYKRGEVTTCSQEA